MNIIKTVGVVGAGTMGAALAQKFAMEGFDVILLDRGSTFIERGMSHITTSLQEAVDRKVLTDEQRTATLARITTSEHIASLSNCDIVVEAIFENFDAKTELLRELSEVVRPDTIIATNTSSFSVTELAHSVIDAGRFCGMHYFYHAAKNRLVEIIAGHETSADTMQVAKQFAFLTGKDPIVCRDQYGFVVNRFFVPWLNEATRLLEEGVASPGAIDAVCRKVFNIGMGPFALMNATGVPVAYHAEKTLEVFGPLYTVSRCLEAQARSNKPWDIDDTSDAVEPATEYIIRERMLGIVFFVCSQILEENICSATELNRGARIGLAWRRGPIEMMQAIGMLEVSRLISDTARRYRVLEPTAFQAVFAPLQYVTLSKYGSTTVLTFARPEDLNALNEDVMAQLDVRFAEANSDETCDTIVLTGSGKAFVAGADIGFFVKNIKSDSIDKIVDFTKYGQEVFDRIDRSPKRVIALVNGMTLGGGLELALCADAIYSLPDAQFAFPETGIGIYPGLGGTQRAQRFVGKGLTKYMIFTGEMISASDACSMGLVDAVIAPDVYFSALEGNTDVLPRSTREIASKWKPVERVFEVNSVDNLLRGISPIEDVTPEVLARWCKRIGQKAPLALHTAERLVNEARGCASELEDLSTIFHTNDALLGLSSIGKKVTFQGN